MNTTPGLMRVKSSHFKTFLIQLNFWSLICLIGILIVLIDLNKFLYKLRVYDFNFLSNYCSNISNFKLMSTSDVHIN